MVAQLSSQHTLHQRLLETAHHLAHALRRHRTRHQQIQKLRRNCSTRRDYDLLAWHIWLPVTIYTSHTEVRTGPITSSESLASLAGFKATRQVIGPSGPVRA